MLMLHGKFQRPSHRNWCLPVVHERWPTIQHRGPSLFKPKPQRCCWLPSFQTCCKSTQGHRPTFLTDNQVLVKTTSTACRRLDHPLIIGLLPRFISDGRALHMSWNDSSQIIWTIGQDSHHPLIGAPSTALTCSINRIMDTRVDRRRGATEITPRFSHVLRTTRVHSAARGVRSCRC